jgi:superfamily II DNA/RNA helicase
MPAADVSRDELAERYLAQLPFAPYPVQEDAILAWFTARQGVLVCAPTGTGKTLIAEAALFEALHTGQMAYYTTPLIALTDQKFAEMQSAAVRWGFSPEDVGLVTGNRRVNPGAKVLVVVAEILLQSQDFDFANVAAVVMDEFHSFADVQRGIVWELSLAMLPSHVRLLLLSATVGNSREFLGWLDQSHGRKLELVEGTERRVPLSYSWVGDQLLNEQLTLMAEGAVDVRRTPALVFCFNREECWNVAEQLKGCHLVSEPQRTQLIDEVNRLDWSQGVGPKLKQILHRGVGVHHAGLLPKYRRIVEDLFQRKLLAVCMCTETLAAGINLPARSVVMTSLVKGPAGDQKLIEASSAHQIFGRAGRPQFDREGFVYVMAHEDDVRIARWKEKYDAIPEDTKDFGLLKAKKALKKKKPTRRETQTYWNQAQFDKLRAAPPGKLYSKGPLPWRLLAYLLSLSPEVGRVREVVRKRLMDEPRRKAGDRALDRMLLTLHNAGFVELDPPPPKPTDEPVDAPAAPKIPAPEASLQLFGNPTGPKGNSLPSKPTEKTPPPEPPRYAAVMARPTPKLAQLLAFRSINPLYGAFLLEHLGIADSLERVQAFESVLGLPRPLLRYVRVPLDLPAGPLATTQLDSMLLVRGLIAAPRSAEGADDEEDGTWEPEEFQRPPTLAEKLRLLFDATYPGMDDVETQSVWSVGELLQFNGKFNSYIKAQDLTKQEGIIFRHFLRFILLCEEFSQVCPTGIEPAAWQAELRSMSDLVTASCREVDPTSTDEVIQLAHAGDVVEGDAHAAIIAK